MQYLVHVLLDPLSGRRDRFPLRRVDISLHPRRNHLRAVRILRVSMKGLLTDTCVQVSDLASGSTASAKLK